MSTIDGKEPAFPLLELSRQTGDVVDQHFGLNVRDYFAAKFMQAICSTQVYCDGNLMDKEVGRHAYEMADAMLEARAVP